MKTTLLLLALFSISQTLKAQGQIDQITRNNLYFEAGGAAFFYSFNYERLLFRSPENNLTARVGLLYLPALNANGRRFSGVPIGASYLKKLKNKYLEAGMSFSAILDQSLEEPDPAFPIDGIEDIVLITSVRFGIRKQPISKGLFWNALLQGSYVTVKDRSDFGEGAENFVTPFLSLGIGYSI